MVSGAWPLCRISRTWKMYFRHEVTTSSNRPTEAMSWTNEIGHAKDLKHSSTGITAGDFETFDSKIVRGLMKISPWNFQKGVFKEREKYKGRQDYRQWDKVHGWSTDISITAIQSSKLSTFPQITDIQKITLRSDNVQSFDTKWDEIIITMQKQSEWELLVNLYFRQLEKCDELK